MERSQASPSSPSPPSSSSSGAKASSSTLTPASARQRLLIVGSYDLFHHGHVRAFKNAKRLFPSAELVVGVVSDDVVLAQKGPPVMRQSERIEVVEACRYVDAVLADTPWIPDAAYLAKHAIDFVVGDEDARHLFHELDEGGLFRDVPRTEGVSSAMILTRVIGNYSAYLKRSVRSGIDMRDYNVSLLRRARVNASLALDAQRSRQPDWAAPQFLGGFLRQVGEKVLGDWSAIGQKREDLIQRQSAARTTATTAVEEEVEDTEGLLREAQFLKLCQGLVPGWKAVTLSDVRFSVVSGGLTNQLTKVALRDDVPDLFRLKPDVARKVLLRVYGAGAEAFFERDTEHRIFEQFSAQGIGPKLYGYFEGGRIEEFLDARSLVTADFQDNLPAIGVKIAEMHRAEVDLPKRPSLFTNLYMWFDAAKSAAAALEKEEDRAFMAKIDLRALEAEMALLQTRLSALQSPLTFCHNDLICGNMMKYPDGRIMFIDYEYGSYNFRGYDFGNHFAEWTMDYTVTAWPKFRIDTARYPSEAQQRTLFAAYVRRSKDLEGAADPTPSEPELQALMDEARKFSLAPHLLWSLWAIKQAATSDIEFGYMDYAVQRIAEYYRLKREVYGD